MFRHAAFRPEGGFPAPVLRGIAEDSPNDIAFVAACEARFPPIPASLAEARRAAQEMQEIARSSLAA